LQQLEAQNQFIECITQWSSFKLGKNWKGGAKNHIASKVELVFYLTFAAQPLLNLT